MRLRATLFVLLMAVLGCGSTEDTEHRELTSETDDGGGGELTAAVATERSEAANRLTLIVRGLVAVFEDGADLVLLIPDGRQPPTDSEILRHQARLIYRNGPANANLPLSSQISCHDKMAESGLDLADRHLELDFSGLQVVAVENPLPVPHRYLQGLALPHLGTVVRDFDANSSAALSSGLVTTSAPSRDGKLVSRIRLKGVGRNDFRTATLGDMRFFLEGTTDTKGKTTPIPIELVLESSRATPVEMCFRSLRADVPCHPFPLAGLTGETLVLIIENHPVPPSPGADCVSGARDFALHYELMMDAPSSKPIPRDVDGSNGGLNNAQCSPVEQG